MLMRCRIAWRIYFGDCKFFGSIAQSRPLLELALYSAAKLISGKFV
jgi:hypothetical protein